MVGMLMMALDLAILFGPWVAVGVAEALALRALRSLEVTPAQFDGSGAEVTP